jgi:hypothetical protein
MCVCMCVIIWGVCECLKTQLPKGIVTESRRLSLKLQPAQMDLILRLAVALSHREFGLPVDSFTPTMAFEWCSKWLGVTAEKDVDHLLGLLVRYAFCAEKGSKTARGYLLDRERIEEMRRLIGT